VAQENTQVLSKVGGIAAMILGVSVFSVFLKQAFINMLRMTGDWSLDYAILAEGAPNLFVFLLVAAAVTMLGINALKSKGRGAYGLPTQSFADFALVVMLLLYAVVSGLLNIGEIGLAVYQNQGLANALNIIITWSFFLFSAALVVFTLLSLLNALKAKAPVRPLRVILLLLTIFVLLFTFRDVIGVNYLDMFPSDRSGREMANLALYIESLQEGYYMAMIVVIRGALALIDAKAERSY
jgi:hypothetical protein